MVASEQYIPKPGDLVIWLGESGEWTVDRIKDDPDHPRPVELRRPMWGDHGFPMLGNAPLDQVIPARGKVTALRYRQRRTA